MFSWRFTYWGSLLSTVITGVSIISGSYASAQIAPDASINNMSNVQVNEDLSIIGGGTQVGNSLFHSFSELSVPTGTSAYFNNAPDIENIFTRVTDTSISNIDGSIRTNGTANLFLVNPNGIVFGSNARLNVGASFAATTANGLKFADGDEFNAINPQRLPVSIIKTQGLQYRESQPGATITTIGNLEVGQDLKFVADKIDLRGKLQVGGNLSLSAQDTVRTSNSVTAPSIDITAGSLIISEGNISNSLGNQGSGTVGNITISSTNLVPNGNGGNITITSTNLVPSGNGGNITVNYTNLFPSGNGSISIDPTNVNSTGSGGNISVNGGSILIITSGLIIAQPVPEPTLTFSMFVTVAFYGAWKLKRKQKQNVG